MALVDVQQRQTTSLVDEVSTLRRHMQAYHMVCFTLMRIYSTEV